MKTANNMNVLENKTIMNKETLRYKGLHIR